MVGGLGVFGLALFVVYTFYEEELTKYFYHLNPKPGLILVESPEIYTRERLINQRLLEDSWLRSQLKKAGDITSFPPQRLSARKTDIGAGSSKGPSGKESSSTKDTSLPTAKFFDKLKPALLFKQEFRLRSAARGLVRRRMIENNLDDRHDLEANTLYILKFDTTVLSSPANGRKALVEVKIKPPIDYQVDEETATDRRNLTATKELTDVSDQEIADLDPKALEWMASIFQKWRSDLMSRVSREAKREATKFRSKSRTSLTSDSDVKERSYAETLVQEFDMVEADRNLIVNTKPAYEDESMAINILAVVAVLKRQFGFKNEDIAIEGPKFYQNQIDQGKPDQGKPGQGKSGQGKSDQPKSDKPKPLPDIDTKSETVEWNIKPASLQRYINISMSMPAKPKGDSSKNGYSSYRPRFFAINQFPKLIPIYLASKGCVSKVEGSKFVKIADDNTNETDGKDLESLEIFLPFDGVQRDYKLIKFWARQLAVWNLDANSKKPENTQNTATRSRRLLESLSEFADLTELVKKYQIDFEPLKFNKKECRKFYSINIKIGFINFIKSILRFKSFSYSVLPRDNALVSLNESGRIGRLRFSSGSIGEIGTSQKKHEASVELKPTVVTFGETIGNRKTPAVGWILDPAATFPETSKTGELVTISESTLAIVSVPSWWRSLRLEISRSWIDKNGVKHPAQEESSVALSEKLASSFSVQLPSSPEVLDSVLLQDFPKNPEIETIDFGKGGWKAWSENECDQGPKTKSILISGKRLWRNTVVTVGNSRATRIELLPNMNGLIAEFDCATTIDQSSEVRVWTSQGVESKPVTAD